MKRCTRSFTLIELLVVVSILALLIAILLPSLKKARDQAKLTVCMSNLKQLGLAFAYYGDDYNQQPPPNRLKVSASAPYGGTPPEFRDSDWWYYAHMVPKHIPPDRKSATNAAFSGVFACPADRDAGRAYSMNIFASNVEDTEPFATQYDRGEAFNPFAVNRAQQYLLIGEAHAIFRDEDSGLYGTRYIIGQGGRSLYEKFLKVTETAQRGPFRGYIDFAKHKDRSDFLFCDLHVEALKRLQVVKESPEKPGKWISSLRVQWSPKDPERDDAGVPTINKPTPP